MNTEKNVLLPLSLGGGGPKTDIFVYKGKHKLYRRRGVAVH